MEWPFLLLRIPAFSLARAWRRRLSAPSLTHTDTHSHTHSLSLTHTHLPPPHPSHTHDTDDAAGQGQGQQQAFADHRKMRLLLERLGVEAVPVAKKGAFKVRAPTGGHESPTPSPARITRPHLMHDATNNLVWTVASQYAHTHTPGPKFEMDSLVRGSSSCCFLHSRPQQHQHHTYTYILIPPSSKQNKTKTNTQTGDDFERALGRLLGEAAAGLAKYKKARWGGVVDWLCLVLCLSLSFLYI